MAHLASAGEADPINLRDWIKLACDLPSKNAFVEGAVDLARAIADHLCRTRIAPSVRLEDCITADNVVIFVDPPPLRAVRAPSIADIKFQFGASDATLLRSDINFSLLPRTDRRLLLALGKILLETFSMGNSDSLEIAAVGADGAATDRSPAESRPAKKRLTADPARGSASAQARNLLLSLGMPISVCQLVSDLLDPGNEESPAPLSLEEVLDDNNKSCFSCAVTSVDEVLFDLKKMKNSPGKFLFDRSKEDACLASSASGHLVGRESEMSVLRTLKNQVSAHVRSDVDDIDSASTHGSNFRCEAIFLSGYAGNGKSSILNALTNVCKEDRWFVLGCKFDKQTAPQTALARAFDDFFGKWGTAVSDRNYDDPEMALSFDKICGHILSAMDDEGLQKLTDLVPNFVKAFPLLSLARSNSTTSDISSMDKVGSGKKRLQNTIHVLLDSLCSVGQPVFFALDDLQWSTSAVMSNVADFVVNYAHYTSGNTGESCLRGLLIAGAYRSNEVKEGDDLLQSIGAMRESGRANVAVLPVGELSGDHVADLVAEWLCLPRRHVRDLAHLVHAKTRGNPFFVTQFLRTIAQNNMLSFSARHRRWVWDCDTVEMQMISEGVAELLSASFSQLSPTLMLALKVLSCLGSQVEESTIHALDSSNTVLTFNISNELQQAVKEGILEKAGPVYQFTHDIIQSNIYETISPDNRRLLHKTLGENLLEHAANNPAMHLLAVDQINIFCKDGNPNADERWLFSRSNAAAAKLAIASSSYDQARLYIDMGIQLLENEHWQTQYDLSLDLFEMSASVSYMNGDAEKMSTCLDEISSHATSFEDLLKASSLLVKLLMSLSKYEQAKKNCLAILSNLGEVFPQEACLPHVLNELASIDLTLRCITTDQIKLLPPMVDRNKLNAMKFLNMLCMQAVNSWPMLLPLASCRMVKLTIEYGFCEDSIVGLATVGLAVFHISDDIPLASHIGDVSESLIEESPRKHILRSRLCKELMTVLKVIKEPMQSILTLLPELYNSAMHVGDRENAMMCRGLYCAGSFMSGALGIVSVSKALRICMKEAGKCQQNSVFHNAMTFLNSCLYLTVGAINEGGVKSFEELQQVGEKTSDALLLWKVFVNQMAIHFWFRRYKDLAQLSENYSAKYPSHQQKRVLHIFRSFFEGIAYLNLARDTQQEKWKTLGKQAVDWMHQLESLSKWNFENKSKLLQAELSYLEGNRISAESLYEESIQSSRDHRFVHEEALAYELYGFFCVETKKVNKGSKQLRLAIEKYKEWGATKKADELELFIGDVDRTNQVLSFRP